MITFINKLSRKIIARGGIPGKVAGRLQRVFWLRTYGVWMSDLATPDVPQLSCREQHAGSVHWELATIEDCLLWSQSGADGFAPWQCVMMSKCIEENRLVLVGYENAENDPAKRVLQVPDCYAILACDRKCVGTRCFFYAESGESVIHNLYVREQSRGRGLATRIYAEVHRRAQEYGLTKMYADIDLSNIASYKTAEKAGAVRIQDAIIYRVSFFKRSYIFARGSLKDRFRQA